MDIEILNADWLKAWSDKDVERLVGFYAANVIYKDPQTAAGIEGHDALRAYLIGLFEATPPMVYTPDEVWAIEGGFCGRWYCAVGDSGKDGRLRGFDLVLLDTFGKIAVNEVYVHDLSGAA